VWAGSLRRYRGALALALLMVAGVVCGLLLTVWSSSTHAVDSRNVVATTFLLLTGAGGLGLFLWARTVLPLSSVTMAFGVGLLVRGVLDAPGSPNVWKFELALPVTIVVLSLLSRRRHTIASVVVLGGLGAVSLLYDARSGFGFCAIAALLVLWQARPTPRSPHRLRWTGVLALGAAGVAAYFAISGLLVSGTLGSDLQQKTTQQISEGGSLLLGGRPEWTATLALMQQSPLGFGLGVVPNPGDVLTAKTGISVAHIPTATGYVEHYLLGNGFELHSILSDLWSAVGPLGLVLGVVMGLFIIRELATLITQRRASALACFFGVAALWYLPFGPLPSNLNDVIFTLGILLPLRAVTVPARRPARAALPRAVPATVAEPGNRPSPVG
jgi:hypothetical protein